MLGYWEFEESEDRGRFRALIVTGGHRSGGYLVRRSCSIVVGICSIIVDSNFSLINASVLIQQNARDTKKNSNSLSNLTRAIAQLANMI